MATKINRIPFNTLPTKIAFDPELGPLFREILTILWQQRERSGGDDDGISDLIARITTAESDIDDAQDDITALQAFDVVIDGRADALEAADIVLSDQIEAIEMQDISMMLLADIISLKRRVKDLEDGNS